MAAFQCFYGICIHVRVCFQVSHFTFRAFKLTCHCFSFHCWCILPGEPGRDMDRAAIAQLSLYQLKSLIFLCLQEFGRRLGIETNEETVFRVTAGRIAPGDLIGETVFSAPGTPPLPRFLCCHRCSRCSAFCDDQDPAHTVHLCPRHGDSRSTHRPY